MTPPTVNAYYDPQNNNINFPAGILQPPFYDNKMDMPVNLGGIGAVIGHELTHGFDDEGGQFDAKGNLDNWWTEKDAKEFASRTQCVEKQYSEYTATDDLKLNGKLTLGENVADNGGLRIAYMAHDGHARRQLPKKETASLRSSVCSSGGVRSGARISGRKRLVFARRPIRTPPPSGG